MNGNNKKDYAFTYAINCALVSDAAGNSRTIKKSELRNEEEEFLIDERLYIASCKNTMDIAEYLNYYSLLITTVRRIGYTLQGTPGRFISLLDAGYVPVYAPPTFLPLEDIMEFMITKLESQGISYYRERQHRVSGPACNTNNQDIWASKMDICRVNDIPLNKFDTIDYLKERLFV